jgi:hypothetical protein
MPALRVAEARGWKFEASLGYIQSLWINKTKWNNNRKLKLAAIVQGFCVPSIKISPQD